jgi:hypothetical protein
MVITIILEKPTEKSYIFLTSHFMDSLSYPFPAYFSYSLALLMASPVIRNGWRFELSNTPWYSMKVLFLSTVLFVLQDVLDRPCRSQGFSMVPGADILLP